MASNKAIINTTRATIYSNPELTIPVGYLRQGQVIEIGEKLLNRERAASIIISGKITYIKTADLTLGGEQAEESRNKNSSIAPLLMTRDVPEDDLPPLQKPEQVLSKGGASFTYHQFVIGQSMDEYLQSSGNGNLASLDFEVWPWAMLGFGLGPYYAWASGSGSGATSIKFNSIGMSASGFLSLPLFSFFSLNGQASYLISPAPLSWEETAGVSHSGTVTGSQFIGFVGLRFGKMEIRGGGGLLQLAGKKFTHEYSSRLRGTTTTTLPSQSTNSIQFFVALTLYI